MTNTNPAIKPLRRYHVLVVGGLSPDAKPKVTSEFEVHAAGCAHIARRVRDGAHGWDALGRSPENVVSAEVADFEACEQDWFADDFKILPCTKDAEVAR
jgi:hypothetical protein